jgi:hypothetical protein
MTEEQRAWLQAQMDEQWCRHPLHLCHWRKFFLQPVPGKRVKYGRKYRNNRNGKVAIPRPEGASAGSDH